MQKVMAITDLRGTLLGVVRTDPIDIGNGKTIRSTPPPAARYRHHILNVADDFMRRPAANIHDEVRRLIGSAKP
jgi:hypothetical protein